MTIINGVRAKYVTAITGGGTAAVSNILSRGGASSWFLESLIPYCKESLVGFLGGKEPEKFVSEHTANQMALKCYLRALELGAKPEEAAGLGATAVLGKIENERAGRQHHAYVSVQLNDSLRCFHVEFPPWTISRREQEDWIASYIQMVLTTDNIDIFTPYKIVRDTFGAMELISSKKRLSHTIDLRDGTWLPFVSPPDKVVVYSGSFNPFHEGHAEVIKKLVAATDKRVWLEISVTNVDKMPVDLLSLKDRIKSINDGIKQYGLGKDVIALALTNTPKFYDKLSLFGPDASFVVGSDTVEELFDLIEVYGTKVYVCHRPGYDFVAPQQYENRFTFLPGTGLQISSTELRNKA